MEFRNRERMPLTLWLGINLLAAILGFFATLQLVLRIRDFLDGLYGLPKAGISLLHFEFRLFFIAGFIVAGMLIGVVTGLIQWWMLRRMYVVSLHWILLSTILWLVSLPLSYEIFAVLHDVFGFSPANLVVSVQLMPLVLFLIYLIGGIIASVGERLFLKITDVYPIDH